MRAVVTGGAGFIGSHLVDALLARGDEVHVLDNLVKGRRENVAARATLHIGDIGDPDKAFVAARPEVVFHLAAQADVRVSVDQPAFDATVNILGTIHVLEAARVCGAKVVFASSGGAIYGECDGPASEIAPRRPVAPYGTAKLCGEEYLATYNRLYGSAHVSLRFGNVFGPRQPVDGEAGVVAIFLGLLRDDGVPMIFGDGGQSRDYVFVADVVRALLLAAAHDGGGVFNVGTGVETSVVDLYAAIQGAAGVVRAPVVAPARLGELRRSVLDSSRAALVFGWRPKIVLADGLALTWAAL